MITIIDDPPYETSGRGMPTTGNKPITIAIFMEKYVKKVIHRPVINKREYLSVVDRAEKIQKATIRL